MADRDNLNKMLAQALMQGSVPDAQDMMMPGGNLGPSASGRANPSWGPLEYAAMAGGGLVGYGTQALGRNLAGVTAAEAPLWMRSLMNAGSAGLGAGAGLLHHRNNIGQRTQNQLPPQAPYSPQVPQEYAGPAYDDGTMYGEPYPTRR